MSEHIHKSHNVSVLIYHFVCPAKYRRVVFRKEVGNSLKEIEARYDMAFLEIGTKKNHVHFLIQSTDLDWAQALTMLVQYLLTAIEKISNNEDTIFLSTTELVC